MTTIKEMIRQANEDGYVDDNAEAKVSLCPTKLKYAYSTSLPH